MRISRRRSNVHLPLSTSTSLTDDSAVAAESTPPALRYEAQSPDEGALVHAASAYGVVISQRSVRRDHEHVEVLLAETNQLVNYLVSDVVAVCGAGQAVVGVAVLS